jgi:hypothetical protein
MEDGLRRWRILASFVRFKVHFGPFHPFPEFGEVKVTEIKTGSVEDVTLCKWFLHSIDDLKLVVRGRSRRLTVTIEDLIVSSHCGIEAMGLSEFTSGERYMANYLRSCDPLTFEGKHICELGSGVGQPEFSPHHGCIRSNPVFFFSNCTRRRSY